MLKNRKGFTLLEILAAVTILGLIMTAAIAGYSKYIKKTKTRYYQKQEELLVQAGRDYFNDNRNTLPRATGETNCVKLKTLLDAKYINKVVDYKQKACNDIDSRVCATKLNKTKYLYHAELNCFTEYKSPDYKTPIVTLSPKQGETITKEKNEPETVVATINYDSKIEADKEETDLASYRYVIYKKTGTNYAVYYDSHWITITKSVRTKKVNIELNSTGTFYVEVWAYNAKGKQGHSKSGEVTLDMNLDCEIGKSIKVSNNNSYEFGTWTNKDITTTFNISGGMTKYTLILLDKDNNTIYTKEANIPPKDSTNKITAEGIYKYKIIGYNSEGETCEGITDQIKIDKTAPICTVTSDTSNWTSEKVTLTATCKDEASGCVQDTRKHVVTTSTTSSYKFEDIYDKASNKGDCNKVEIKIDNTGPTINVVGYLMKKNTDNSFSYIDKSGNVVSSKEKAAKYTFGAWTKDYVRLFSDGEDKESGLAKNAEVFIKKGSTTGIDSQGVWKNCSTEIPRSYTVQSQGSSDLKFRNIDNTGNKTESEYVNVKLDRTGPTYKMNSVINSDGSITLTASNIKDSYSGVKEYGKNVLCQYQTNNGSSWSSWANCSTSNSAKISSSSVKKVKFRVQDKVGNITEKEEEVDIDMEAPTLKVTAGRCSDSSSSAKCSNSNFKGTTQVQTAKGNTKNITFTAWSLDGLKINYEVTEENIKEIKWSWNDSNIFDTLNTTIKDSSTTTTKKDTKTLIAPGRRYGVITATDMNGKTSKVTITVYISISINVTFNKNDGTTKPDELQQSFNYGKKDQKFEKTFTRSGYTLLGWSNNASATKSDYKIDNGVSDTWILKNRSNTKLYAVWSTCSYKVKFNSNGGNGTMADETFTYGTAKNLTNNAFTKTGSTFAGWATSPTGGVKYTNKESVKNLTSTCNGTINLYAVWSTCSYKVKFNSNGGNGTMADETFTYGTAKNLTNNAFTKDGSKFAGWATSPTGGVKYTNKESVKNLTSTCNGTVNLYAVWSTCSYKVKFNANGGTGTMADETFTYGAAKNLTNNAFTKTGSTFAGWATSPTGGVKYTNKESVKNLTSTCDGIVNLYAVWSTCSYKVKFNANGGTGTMADETFTYGTAKNLTNNAFTKTGSTFAGWATSPTGGVKYTNKESVKNLTSTCNGTINLYAKWTACSYKVKFNSNGGTGTMSNETFTYGTAKNLTNNEFTKTGYTFDGWATSASGAVKYSNKESVKNLTATCDGIVNLYAKWTTCSYKVKFNANGGTGTMADETFTYGTAKNLTNNAFTRTGYTFDGWATSASGAVKYSNKESVKDLTATCDGIVNLYAKWTAKPVEAYCSNGTESWSNNSSLLSFNGTNVSKYYYKKYGTSSFSSTSSTSVNVKYYHARFYGKSSADTKTSEVDCYSRFDNLKPYTPTYTIDEYSGPSKEYKCDSDSEKLLKDRHCEVWIDAGTETDTFSIKGSTSANDQPETAESGESWWESSGWDEKTSNYTYSPATGYNWRTMSETVTDRAGNKSATLYVRICFKKSNYCYSW